MIGKKRLFMPEGPECRRYALAFGEHAGGEILTNISILSGRYTKKDMPGLIELERNLPLQIRGVGVHGKFIYAIFDGKSSLWSTLGMTGSWQKEESSHSRVRLDFESGKKVFFNDMRNFGTIKYCEDPKLLSTKLESLGPDMLAEEVSNEVFISQMRRNNDNNVTKALMDQSIVSGIGNYIKSEALWLARINPYKKVSQIPDTNLKILNKAVQSVMRESFISGGATIRSYKDFFGESGNYSSRFMVYNQKEDPDGNEVIKEKTPDGRTTHWVPTIQG